jgi:hypothetical protein
MHEDFHDIETILLDPWLAISGVIRRLDQLGSLTEASHLTTFFQKLSMQASTIHSPETTSLSKNHDRASVGATACTSNITFTVEASFGSLTGKNRDAIS